MTRRSGRRLFAGVAVLLSLVALVIPFAYMLRSRPVSSARSVGGVSSRAVERGNEKAHQTAAAKSAPADDVANNFGSADMEPKEAGSLEYQPNTAGSDAAQRIPGHRLEPREIAVELDSVSNKFSAATHIEVYASNFRWSQKVEWSALGESMRGHCLVRVPTGVAEVVLEPVSAAHTRWQPTKSVVSKARGNTSVVFTMMDTSPAVLEFEVVGISQQIVPEDLSLSWILEDECDVVVHRVSAIEMHGRVRLKGTYDGARFIVAVAGTGVVPFVRHSSQLIIDTDGAYRLTAAPSRGWGQYVMLRGCLSWMPSSLVVDVDGEPVSVALGPDGVLVQHSRTPKSARVRVGSASKLITLHDLFGGAGLVVIDQQSLR